MNPTSERSLKVFVAHSRYDKAFAREIYLLLSADGFDPWLDEESLLPGQDWEHEIKKAVREADAVALLLSREGVDGAGYLQKELALILDIAQQQPQGRIFLIPLRLGECQLPERVRHLHWLTVDPTDGPIGRTYLRLQRALLHRAVEMGLVELEDLHARSLFDQVKGSGKTDLGVKLGLPVSDRFLGVGLEGEYLVRGQNPDRSRYYGTAEIIRAQDGLILTATIGPHVLGYLGGCDGFTLAFTGAHEVSYSVEPGGFLLGRWGGDGIEELIPASPFFRRGRRRMAEERPLDSK